MQFPFFRKSKKTRLLVIGLDCAAPKLVFDQFNAELPTFRTLMQQGTWGILNSSIPCITVPAWASMTTSRDPGVLGVYGFRNRSSYDYDSLVTVDNAAITQPRVWDILGDAGYESLIMNVPQTYPIRRINGHLISGLLTPNTDSQFAYPAIFKQEILKHFPDYAFDVRDFRKMDRVALLQQLVDLSEIQYRALDYALKQKSWDFAMHVNIGVDRLHHAFWRYYDPQHRLYEANNRFQHAIRDYYIMVDHWLKHLLEKYDDATVLIVSDHGAKRMEGAICINQWLLNNGWLVLKQPIPDGEITPFSADLVDWGKTRAWSIGGYYGRIFLNVVGREPQGMIPADHYELVRDELVAELASIPASDGMLFKTTCYKPQEIYHQVNGIPPDLLVYFGDLHWRTVGGLGYDSIYTFENDTGPDDANHAVEGLFILYDPKRRGVGHIADQQLMDIAPTILSQMKVDIPASMQGSVIR